jgi:hypothetical protein
MYYVQIEILVEFLSRWRGKDEMTDSLSYSKIRERQGYIIIAKGYIYRGHHGDQLQICTCSK